MIAVAAPLVHQRNEGRRQLHAEPAVRFPYLPRKRWTRVPGPYGTALIAGSSHNHEPSQHLSAHPAHRILSEEDKSKVASLSEAGIAPRDIRTYIRQNSNTIATQQDIYNRIADAKRDVCEGQSTIQAFANQLDREGFWSRVQYAPNGQVTAVLFAHPDSLAYLQAYPDTLLPDYTYKTNRYKMPLLDIVGVDACQRSFCIALHSLVAKGKKTISGH